MSKELTKDFKLDNVFILEAYNDQNIAIATGTCFAVAESIFFTAYHVLSDARSLKIFRNRDEYYSDTSHSVECVLFDAESDFAILTSSTFKTSCIIELGQYQSELGDEIRAIGYSAEKSRLHFPVTSKISNIFDFSSTYKYDFEFGKPAEIAHAGGLSGGPVFFKNYAIGFLAIQTIGSALQAVSFRSLFQKQSIKDYINNSGISIIDGEEISFDGIPHPESPFNISIDCSIAEPNIKGLDIGFDLGEWRRGNLIDQALNWVEDYALTPKEKSALSTHSFKRIQSARRNFKIEDPAALADLLLHIAIRQNHKTIPIISNTTTIDGEAIFSCSHIVISNGKVELWLGISAMEENLENAVKEAIHRVDLLIRAGGIKDRLVFILAALEPSWPHISKLEKLSMPNLSLSEKFDKIIIPILLCSNSETINKYNPSKFLDLFQSDVDECRNRVVSAYNSHIVPLIDLRVFLFPVDDVQKLHDTFATEFNA
ncbi:SAVED domain-containing protein [Pseudomonas sp. DCB_AW]|uniref:Hachiman antiphage defense system protein HamA n=1 Tax=Pseudomonas sp. DCB_AW TaxID=2993596 RepID=UPI0022494C67|nr:Hachiman antiphage defense system protein HamA [Pseudomonas sp. DCB_AW]MCX2688087.1 SAVED domain-containing protein [Pseudomonas sp. DCB_AW]